MLFGQAFHGICKVGSGKMQVIRCQRWCFLASAASARPRCAVQIYAHRVHAVMSRGSEPLAGISVHKGIKLQGDCSSSATRVARSQADRHRYLVHAPADYVINEQPQLPPRWKSALSL